MTREEVVQAVEQIMIDLDAGDPALASELLDRIVSLLRASESEAAGLMMFDNDRYGELLGRIDIHRKFTSRGPAMGTYIWAVLRDRWGTQVLDSPGGNRIHAVQGVVERMRLTEEWS